MKTITVKDERSKAWITEFLDNSRIIEKIKLTYISKWQKLLIELAEKPLLTKQYFKIVNSDISSSGAYLDSILTDYLADLACVNSSNNPIINNYLNHRHIYSLLIMSRSIILNTAYINIYKDLQQDLEVLDYDFRQHMPSIDKSKKNGTTLLDVFKDMVSIFKFGNGNKIAMISQLDENTKKLLLSKGIEDGKSKQVSELMLIKNLEYNLNQSYPNVFKNEEILTLYELTSKSFHRHEMLMYIMNNLLNDRKKINIDKMVNDTVVRIIKINIALYGYQINSLYNLLNLPSSIHKDVKELMAMNEIRDVS